MKKALIYLTFICFFSCKQNNEKKHDSVINERERSKAYYPIYKRCWIDRKNPNNQNELNESIELYVSQRFDTIPNQHLVYINNTLDSTRSHFYELQIDETDKQNVYKGKIKFHSEFDIKKISKKRRMRMYFSFREETKDSTFFTKVRVKNKNEIEFEYKNIVNKAIQGVIIQNVEIDTIINNEEMVRMIEYRVLVDNYAKTLNFCLEAYGFDKGEKIHIDNKKIKPIN